MAVKNVKITNEQIRAGIIPTKERQEELREKQLIKLRESYETEISAEEVMDLLDDYFLYCLEPDNNHPIATLNGFGIFIGKPLDWFEALSIINDELYNYIDTRIEDAVINAVASSKVSQQFGVFYLKNKHSFDDKTEVEQTVSTVNRVLGDEPKE